MFHRVKTLIADCGCNQFFTRTTHGRFTLADAALTDRRKNAWTSRKIHRRFGRCR